MKLHHLHILSLASFLALSAQGHAATWQNALTARLTTEYDSNPTFSANDQRSVWRGLLEPGYQLTGTMGNDELRTGVGVQIARSSDEALSPMRNSPSAFIDWLHTLDSGEFGLGARYAEIATRDAVIEATGPVPVTSTRAARSLSARLRTALSSRSSVALEGAYEKFSYEGNSFVDYDTRSASLMFSYAASDSITPFIRGAYADYVPANDGTVIRVTTGALGLDFELTDSVSGSAQAGKYKISNVDEQGTTGEARLQYTGERNQLRLNTGRTISPSGLGGFTTVDQAGLNWSHDLSALSSSGLDLGWRRSNYTTAVTHRSAGIWLRHELSSYWAIRLYHLHNMLSGDAIADAHANITGLNLAYTYSDF